MQSWLSPLIILNLRQTKLKLTVNSTAYMEMNNWLLDLSKPMNWVNYKRLDTLLWSLMNILDSGSALTKMMILKA